MTVSTSHLLIQLPMNVQCRIAKLGNIPPSELKRLRDLGLYVGSVTSVFFFFFFFFFFFVFVFAVNRGVAAEIKVVRIFQ